MSLLRLSPSASITVTPAGVMLRSDLGTIQITGADVGTFVDRIVPLCDGTRDRDAIRAALPEYAPHSVDVLLDLLQKRRLLEVVPDTQAPDRERFRGQEEFLRRWPGAAADPMAPLGAGRVTVVGLEPWGAAAAIELAAAGLGAIRLVDDDVTAREAAAGRIRDLAAWCRVEVAAMDALDGVETDLLVVALPAEDTEVVERVARAAHRANVRSLWSQGSGLTVGPLVVPGRTACRICAAAEGLNPALGGPGVKRPGAEAMLGHLVALEVIKVITGYAPSALAGRVIRVDPATFETTLHTLVRLPWCRVCGSAAAA